MHQAGRQTKFNGDSSSADPAEIMIEIASRAKHNKLEPNPKYQVVTIMSQSRS